MVGRMGTRGTSMGTSAVRVGRWTLSESMASFGVEVCIGRGLGSLEGEDGAEWNLEGVEGGVSLAVRMEAGAMVEA